MEHTARNEVLLLGRLSVAPEERDLPSGDVIVTFRVVVDRPPTRKGEPASRVTIDTLDCVARTAAVRRTVQSWEPGDVVEAEGSLRRRFFRGAGGLGSRYEVEVTRAKRWARAT
jgi:single-strand DNA-binding protein